MTSSKRNGSARSRLTTSPTSAPSPALSTILASGESAISEDTCRSTPIRKTSSTSLATAAARSTTSLATPPTSKQDRNTTPNGTEDLGKRRSWFGKKGTWPRSGQKSTPVTWVAQEHVARESSSPLAAEQPTDTVVLPNKLPSDEYAPRNCSTGSLPRPPRMKLTRPTIAPPQETLAQETTSVLPPPVTALAPEQEPEPEPEPVPVPEHVPEHAPELAQEPAPVDSPKFDTTVAPQLSASVVQTTGSWIPLAGWWYGAPPPTAPTAPEPEGTEEPAEEPIKESPVEDSAVEEPIKEPEVLLPPDDSKQENQPKLISGMDGSADSLKSTHSRSWFGLWGGGPEAAPAVAPDVPVEEALPAEAPTQPLPIVELPPTPAPTVNVSPQSEPITASNTQPNKGYGWAFWSYAKAVDTNSIRSTEGELAVSGSPSEFNPQKTKIKQSAIPSTPLKSSSAVSLLQEDSRPETPKSSKSKSTTFRTVPSASQKVQTNGAAALQPSSASIVAAAETNAAIVAAAETSAAKKKLQNMMIPQNHLLPAFDSCCGRPDQPSILQQFTKIFRKHPPSQNHIYIAQQTPRIKKAVAIGVHGFFPMRLVRTVLGEPTGTSVRFATHAASSIKRWAEKNGVDVEVEKIALEGEGKVADRVDTLWGLLQNWKDHVCSADFILMAAHSQGVVVGMQLLARLIEEGWVDNARIGFTAMAGINLGPFAHLPTTLLTGSARELFEFQKQESTVSRKYIQAIRTVLAQNARILYVGSIDDQLVSLESSTMTNISHPYIYRAVFVDGRVHAPDFLSHLVGFAMKLRNLGIPDHGLIRELSSPLAGSLYGGEGHSRIYNDGAVYDLGVRHALETTECTGIPLRVQPFELSTSGNPYFLPWSLRGMLEETFVRDKLADECGQLLEQFEKWKPTSKTLKDVKFRLEGIRSKL